ncbi:OsmC family peroxiredoxin [Ornithinimicrobium avium]|nr:OsmC family peroxiredoxin [Ornithinimicrobium avium]
MDPLAQQIVDLTAGWRTGAPAEAEVLRILREVPDAELDAVLADLDVDKVVGDVDDHAWGPDHRTELLDLLLRERVDELSPSTLAGVISALHSGPTPRSHQEAIVDVLVSRSGASFHDLKYRLNATGDYHDLEHLVFQDIDEDLRGRLLEHFAAQAGVDPTSDLRVLCDIDDTVRCAIHDDRYPRGTVYPGVVELLQALDDGAAEEPGRAGDLTFVTARPSGPRGLVEQYTRNGLAVLGLPPHAVLGGSLLNLHTKAAIAERKVQNMERDHLLFPECRMVFVGDSGQADGQVGAQMHRTAPGHVVGTLLHNVTDLTAQERADWARQGVHVFDTYAGAAAHALRLGLVSGEQARAVAAATREGLVALDLEPEERQRLERDLAVDEAAVEELVGRPARQGPRPMGEDGRSPVGAAGRRRQEDQMALTSTASATWKGNLFQGSGVTRMDSSGLGTFDLNWKARTEEGQAATNPEELLGAAHAGCFSMAFSNALDQNGTPPTQLDTQAEVTFDTSDGPTITGVHLTVRGQVEGISAEDFQRIAEEAKAGCPVSKALAGTSITLTAELA